MTPDTPDIKTMITTDAGLAIFIFLPVFMVAAVLIGLALQESYNVKMEDIYVLAALLVVFLMLISPVIIWWSYVIKRIFGDGIVCKGEIISAHTTMFLNANLTIIIKCNNEVVEKKINYINTAKVKNAVLKKDVTVLTNKKLSTFFIKEAFIDE